MFTGVLGILVQLFCGVRSTVFVAPGFAGLCLVLILLVFDAYLMVLVIDCEFVFVGFCCLLVGCGYRKDFCVSVGDLLIIVWGSCD